jgi:hypothetical protein
MLPGVAINPWQAMQCDGLSLLLLLLLLLPGVCMGLGPLRQPRRW